MIKELKSFSPCEIMSCSPKHHKMSPDAPRAQPGAAKGCLRRVAWPAQRPGRGGPDRAGLERCGRPREQQCGRRAAQDFYRGQGGREGKLKTEPRSGPRASRKGLPGDESGGPGTCGRTLLQNRANWRPALCVGREITSLGADPTVSAAGRSGWGGCF